MQRSTASMLSGGDAAKVIQPPRGSDAWQLPLRKVLVNVTVALAWLHSVTWKFAVVTVDVAGHLPLPGHTCEGGQGKYTDALL